MKTTIARITLLCTAAAAALHASAQSLQKEITVRHESAPERIDSRRLPLNPLVTLPKSTASNLRYSSRDIRIDVPQTLTTSLRHHTATPSPIHPSVDTLRSDS